MKTKGTIKNIRTHVARDADMVYAQTICQLIAHAAMIRGTGIARRSEEYIKEKIRNGNAVVATHNGELAGFCYIETWSHGKYTANSGLIVHPDFQGLGIGRKIKEKAFELSRKKYPDAKIFGITTSLAVMKINSKLGYEPVTFSELTEDEQFWQGCSGCINFDILNRTNRSHCLCTGMLYDPHKKKSKLKRNAKERWERFLGFVKKYKTKYQNGQEKSFRQLIKINNRVGALLKISD